MKNLKEYMENTNSKTFNTLVVLDYLGSVGYEITKDDVKYIEDNGYSIDDFDDRQEDLPIIVID